MVHTDLYVCFYIVIYSKLLSGTECEIFPTF